MHVKNRFFVFLLSISVSFPLMAQFTKGMNYSVETGINFSGGEHTPLWLTANKQGLSSIEKNNGYLRAGIFRPLEDDKHFSYGFGIDLAGAYHFTSSFIVQQAYFDLKYRCLGLSVGSKEYGSELKNQLLTSGGMTYSGNARPIPQVRIGIPEYTLIPGTKGLFRIKGHLSYGMFTGDNWQEDFVTPGNKYTEHVLYHSKALFVKLGDYKKFPLVFEGGIEMQAQFGGNAFNVEYMGEKKYIDMPNKLEDFFKVLIPSGGDSSTPMGEQTNVYGNHVGSWNFSLGYQLEDWNARVYYEHFFEDASQMWGEYGWKDCLAGVEITFPKNRFISSFVYEYIGTKDQSGPIFHDKTPEIPDQVSAVDEYYNHYIYTGWQHWGMGIGNPLIVAPLYNNGDIRFMSNRIKGHHVGFMGQPMADLGYRVLFSYTKNWGGYKEPFSEVKDNINGLLEVTYKPHQLKTWDFVASLAFDAGDLLGKSVGGMITVRKTGLLTKSK